MDNATARRGEVSLLGSALDESTTDGSAQCDCSLSTTTAVRISLCPFDQLLNNDYQGLLSDGLLAHRFWVIFGKQWWGLYVPMAAILITAREPMTTQNLEFLLTSPLG